MKLFLLYLLIFICFYFFLFFFYVFPIFHENRIKLVHLCGFLFFENRHLDFYFFPIFSDLTSQFGFGYDFLNCLMYFFKKTFYFIKIKAIAAFFLMKWDLIYYSFNLYRHMHVHSLNVGNIKGQYKIMNIHVNRSLIFITMSMLHFCVIHWVF